MRLYSLRDPKLFVSSYLGNDALHAFNPKPFAEAVKGAAFSLLRTSQNDSWADQSQLRSVMDIVIRTDEGRKLAENAATTGTSLMFDRSLPLGRATISGYPSIVRLCPDDPPACGANTCMHELGHEWQDCRIELSMGRRDAFDRNAQTIGDIIYPKIVMEGVSLTLQVLNAYELFTQGIHEPWLRACFSSYMRPFAFELLKRLEDGVSLQSDPMRRALFDAGMKQGDFRWGYEAEHLRYLAAHFRDLRISDIGITHRNDDLWCIAENTAGNSYLHDVDLKDRIYVRCLGDLFSYQETIKAARTASAHEKFVMSFGRARQIVDVIEYHVGIADALVGLPDSYSSERILYSPPFLITFGQAIKRAAQICYTYGGISEGETRINWLLSRAQQLADKYTIPDWFAASVEAGQQASRALRDVRFTGDTMPEGPRLEFG